MMIWKRTFKELFYKRKVMALGKSILDLVGNTPLIKINNLIEKEKGQLLLKYEKVNPGGSVKDRSAKFIVEEAERLGILKPGGTIIESSSGNFGISLSMIGAVKGYKVVILVDPKTTQSNLSLLKAFGAEVIVVTEKDDCGSYHKTRIALANKLANETVNSFRPDQCFSLLNGLAHYKNTAAEIVDSVGADNIEAIVVAVSTGGQIGGISKYVKEKYPFIKIIGVDAKGSVVFGGEPYSYKTPGVGLGWTPNNIDMDLIDEAFVIDDEIAFIAARAFAKYEGILIGPSSGACALIGMHIANKIKSNKNVICMVADSGERYINTLFNDDWMKQQGFTTNISIEELQNILINLKGKDTHLIENRAYNPYLVEELNVPKTTITINNRILKGEYI